MSSRPSASGRQESSVDNPVTTYGKSRPRYAAVRPGRLGAINKEMRPISETQSVEDLRFRIINGRPLSLPEPREDTSPGSGKPFIEDTDAVTELIGLAGLHMESGPSTNFNRGFPVISRQPGSGTLYVKNLCIDATNQLLKEVFETVGRVINAEIDPSTRYSPNIRGVVDFARASKAAEAEERFNNTCQPRICGVHKLQIEMYTWVEPGRSGEDSTRQSSTHEIDAGRPCIGTLSKYETGDDGLFEELDTQISGKPVPAFEPGLATLEKNTKKTQLSRMPEKQMSTAPIFRTSLTPAITVWNQTTPTRSVFLSNLQRDIKRDEIRQFFGDSGKVTGIHLRRSTNREQVQAVVDFRTLNEAKDVMHTLSSTYATSCGGQRLEIEYSLVSAVESNVQDFGIRDLSQPASQLAADLAQSRVGLGGEYDTSAKSSASRLSPSAQSFKPSTAGAGQISGKVPSIAPQNTDLGSAQLRAQGSQQPGLKRSPILKIQNIEVRWSQREVTSRLRSVIGNRPFTPDPLNLFPDKNGNCTFVRFVDAGASEAAMPFIAASRLDGSRKLRVSYTSENFALGPPPFKGRLQLDNISPQWIGRDRKVQDEIHRMVNGSMRDLPTGSLLGTIETPPNVEGTFSCILTFVSPEIAMLVLPRLHLRDFGGGTSLRARILPLQ